MLFCVLEVVDLSKVEVGLPDSTMLEEDAGAEEEELVRAIELVTADPPVVLFVVLLVTRDVGVLAELLDVNCIMSVDEVLIQTGDPLLDLGIEIEELFVVEIPAQLLEGEEVLEFAVFEDMVVGATIEVDMLVEEELAGEASVE